MSLLQEPRLALDQVEWYLDHSSEECFPGALLLAAGNLCRHVLEQVLFILAFYGRVPKRRWIKTDGSLQTAWSVLKALEETDPSTGRNYFDSARRRSPRVRKFARHPRSLHRWRRLLNEPSHFRNPAARRRTRERHLRDFVRRWRQILDEKDGHLIVAAVNELRSGGVLRAEILDDAEYTPAVRSQLLVEPKQLELERDGRLSLKTPTPNVIVVPSDREVPLRWSRSIVLVAHAAQMHLTFEWVTAWGQVVDIRDRDALLRTFWSNPRTRRQLKQRAGKLGIRFEFQ